MYQKPATPEALELFKSDIDLYLRKWNRLTGIRRKVAQEDIRESVDLMNMLLAYNQPGLPGFVQGGDVPGTDIHSLYKKEHLMGKYFPFSNKQGLANKFLTRDNIFFEFSALSQFYDEPVFLFFTDKEKSEELNKLFEEKVKSIIEWFRIVFKRQFYFQFIDSNTGEPFLSNFSIQYPKMRKDIFQFLLLADFIPLGLPYFLYKLKSIKVSDINISWKQTFAQTTFERFFYITDIFYHLPATNAEQFFPFFVDWTVRKGSESLMETHLYSHIIMMEYKMKGLITNTINEYFSQTEMFYHPSIFHYFLYRQSIDSEIREIEDRAFYLTLRNKKQIILVGVKIVLQNYEMAFLKPYLNEPVNFSLDNYSNIQKDEHKIRQKLKESIYNLRETRDRLIYRFCVSMEETYNLSETYLFKSRYPISISAFKFDDVIISYHGEVENTWELIISSHDGDVSETIHQCDSAEEIILFAILNGIDRSHGLHYVNVDHNISSRIGKLWKTIENWLVSPEKIFIGINYVSQKQTDDGTLSISTGEDIINIGEKQSLIQEISLFIKGRKFGMVKAFSYTGENPLSHVMSKLIHIPTSYEDFRITMCYDVWYRPIVARVESLLKQNKKYPFIMKEQGTFSFITRENVVVMHSFSDILTLMNKKKLQEFYVDEVSRELIPYYKLGRRCKKDSNQIFFLGGKIKELLVFASGIYVGGYKVSGPERLKKFMISLFSFFNSVSALAQSTTPLEVYSYQAKGDGFDGRFQDITATVEFESLNSRRSLAGLKISENSLSLKVDGKEFAGNTLYEIVQEYLRVCKDRELLIDFCSAFPKEEMTIFEIVEHKLTLERMTKHKTSMYETGLI